MLSCKCIFEKFPSRACCRQHAILSLIQVREVEAHPLWNYYEAILINDGCQQFIELHF